MNQRIATSLSLLMALVLATVCGLSHQPGIPSAHAQQAGADLTPIYAIQGSGLASPLREMRVDTFGLVTALTPAGFYLQDPAGDANPFTSDGLYVFTYSEPARTFPAVRRGACVVVRDALVQEYYGKTELSRIDDVEVSSLCGDEPLQAIPLPPLHLGMDAQARFERFEGMLVAVDGLDAIVHGPTKHYVSGESEIAYLPDALEPAIQHGRILRGDAAGLESASDPWPGHALQYVSSLVGGDLPDANWGDRIRSAEDGESPLRGILDYNFGKYQLLLLPGEIVTVQSQAVAKGDGLVTSPHDFTICTYNVYGLGRGEAQYPQNRQYDRALQRTAEVIAGPMHGCTIIGLQETGAPADAAALAALLTQRYALPYRAIAMEGPLTADPEFPLTNSFLVRSDRVEVVDWFSVQGCSPRDYGVRVLAGETCPTGQFPLFNRPPLVMDARVTGAWGEPVRLRLVNNHWKSKAGDEVVNAGRRLLQAEHVARIVNESHSQAVAENIIVLGDLNDFSDSAPLLRLTEAASAAYPLIDTWDLLPDGDRYSYIFNGVSQVLDHILISPNVVQSLSGLDTLHINADRAMCDAGLETQTCQASDHDPLMMRLRPGGAAAVGGDSPYAGIAVEIEHLESGSVYRATTGHDGGFRVWDVPVGEVHVRFIPPEWVVMDETEVTMTVGAGLTMMEMPEARLEPAMRAAASAALLADAAGRSILGR